MEITAEEKEQLKKNSLAIKDFLIDLIKDYPTTINITVKFGERCSITVDNYSKEKEVYGYIGGLRITFIDDKEVANSKPWTYCDYGIQLLTNWQSIKYQMKEEVERYKAQRAAIMNFQL